MYIAFCQDRHLDPEVKLFVQEQNAIRWCREYMTRQMAHPDGLIEEYVTEDRDDGITWSMSYKYESDYAFVKRAEAEDA